MKHYDASVYSLMANIFYEYKACKEKGTSKV